MPLPSDDKIVQLANDLLAQLDTIFGLHPGFRPIVLVGDIGRDADLMLGVAVPELKVAIPDWPIDQPGRQVPGFLIRRLHSKVVGHEARAGAEPVA